MPELLPSPETHQPAQNGSAHVTNWRSRDTRSRLSTSCSRRVWRADALAQTYQKKLRDYIVEIGVFGATGTIGQRVVTEALARGHHVTAFTRDPLRVVPAAGRL